MMVKLWFTKDGRDITEGLELRDGRALPGGWNTHEVWVTELGGECEVDVHIADLYCGEPINVIDGYGFRKDESNPFDDEP
jgi:hypothetical protein